MYLHYTTRNDTDAMVTIEVNPEADMLAEDAQWMLWAYAPLSASAPTEDELERIRSLVLELEACLELAHGAVFAGRRFVEGWAEIYFYALFTKGAEKTFREAFAGYGFAWIEYGAFRDARHTFYHENLAPDAFADAQIKSREIIDQLRAAGDTLERPRRVEHYLFFQTASAMRRTADHLAAHLQSDNRIETGLEARDEYAHGLMIELEHACTLAVLEDVVHPLVETALRDHGVYLGWSTEMAV